MKRTLAASAVAALSLVLSGCFGPPPVDQTWQPPDWPASTLTALNALPDPIDATSLPLVDHGFLNPDVRVAGRISYLPGDEADDFNRAVDAAVHAGLAVAQAHSGVTYTPQRATLASRGCVTGSTLLPARTLLSDAEFGVGGDGTVIACDIVLASGTLFGERIRTVVGAGGVVASDTSVTIFTDTATGEVATGNELWQKLAADALFSDAVGALKHMHGGLGNATAKPDSAELRTALAHALASATPTRDGELTFSIGAGFTTAELDGVGVTSLAQPQHFAVSAESMPQLATEFGQRVASASSGAFTRIALGLPSTDWADCTIVACVALTFDDGPHAENTALLLDTAGELRVPLTFFVLGVQAEQLPELLARTHDEGHEIGNHTFSHNDLRNLDDDGVRDQLDRTSALIAQATGARPTMFRPPYGSVDDRVLEIAGMPAINWSVDTNDFEQPDSATLVSRATDPTEAGAIVLLHDIYASSVSAAPEIFTTLRDEGFTLVTVSRLFGGKAPADGAWASATTAW